MVVRHITVLEPWLVSSQEMLANVIFHTLFVIKINFKNLKREGEEETW